MSDLHTPESVPNERIRITRTVAIIKNHALDHRMAIERKIEEASFEIVKERQIELDQSSDHEFLQELFGDDVPSLFDGPVWVYILERRRAVEVFKALMGEADPAIARHHSPNSIRALFGDSLKHNAIMGSPSLDIAEEQISCLFQSSPPFLPQDDDDMDEPEDFAIASNRDALSPSSSHQSHSAHLTSSGSRGTTSVTSNGSLGASLSGKAALKARTMSRTSLVPDIEPRMSRAAALRVGLAVPSNSEDGPRVRRTKQEQTELFMDVPGHKRSGVIAVASTAPPAISPRMSRAAALRLGLVDPELQKTKPRSPTSGDSKATFVGIPGHKRAETIPVASVQAPPTILPRLNKSAELRAKRDSAPPTSFMFRQPTTPKLPRAYSRSPSTQPPASPSLSRPKSSLDDTARKFTGSPLLNALNGRLSALGISSMSTRAPTIEPRTNRSLQLRMAKMQSAASLPRRPPSHLRC